MVSRWGLQVIYNGFPLYLYTGDQDNEATNGHQLNAQCYLVQMEPTLETFILSSSYHQYLQASYPPGSYSAFWLGNLPERTADKPLVITNFGGQVVIDDSSSSKFVLAGAKTG